MRGGIVVTVEADQVRVESRLLAGQVGCPGCPGALRPWGWARPRGVRGIAGVLRPRRAHVGSCQRPAPAPVNGRTEIRASRRPVCLAVQRERSGDLDAASSGS